MGYVEYWTDYLTSRSVWMAIPPPACFEALVVANQANATGTQQVLRDLPFTGPVQCVSNQCAHR